VVRTFARRVAGFFMPKIQPNDPLTEASRAQIPMEIPMTNQIVEDIDDDDEEYDEEDDYEIYMGHDNWEDQPGYQLLLAAMPKGWHMVKVVRFNFGSLTNLEEWLSSECIGRYKRVGFTSGCSTKVAIQFENHVDASFFRLRWS
jgi:hypothetical protein